MFEQQYLDDRFLFAEGEPYGEDDTVFVNDAGNPVSLWSAIQLMREEEPHTFARMALQDWQLDDPSLLLCEAVMLKAIEFHRVRHHYPFTRRHYVRISEHYELEVWPHESSKDSPFLKAA